MSPMHTHTKPLAEETLFLPSLTKHRMQITGVRELAVPNQVRLANHSPLMPLSPSLQARDLSSPAVATAPPVAAPASYVCCFLDFFSRYQVASLSDLFGVQLASPVSRSRPTVT